MDQSWAPVTWPDTHLRLSHQAARGEPADYVWYTAGIAPIKLVFIAMGLLGLNFLILPVTAMLLLRQDVRDWIDSRL